MPNPLHRGHTLVKQPRIKNMQVPNGLNCQPYLSVTLPGKPALKFWRGYNEEML